MAVHDIYDADGHLDELQALNEREDLAEKLLRSIENKLDELNTVIDTAVEGADVEALRTIDNTLGTIQQVFMLEVLICRDY